MANVADKIIGRFKPSYEEKSKGELDLYNAETERIKVQQPETLAEHEERMQRLKIEQAVAQSAEAAKIRPRIGNVTVFGFVVMISPIAAIVGITIIRIFIDFIRSMFGFPPIPEPDLKALYELINLQKEYKEMLYVLLATALGQGYLRTKEKMAGAANNR